MPAKRSIAVTAALIGIMLVALYDLWSSLEAVQFIMARGSSLSAALFSPPTSIIRLVACALILCGASLMLKPKKGGFLLIAPGLTLYAVLVFSLATQSFGSSIWGSEALRLIIFLALIAIIAVIRAFRRKSAAAPH